MTFDTKGKPSLECSGSAAGRLLGQPPRSLDALNAAMDGSGVRGPSTFTVRQDYGGHSPVASVDSEAGARSIQSHTSDLRFQRTAIR